MGGDAVRGADAFIHHHLLYFCDTVTCNGGRDNQKFLMVFAVKRGMGPDRWESSIASFHCVLQSQLVTQALGRIMHKTILLKTKAELEDAARQWGPHLIGRLPLRRESETYENLRKIPKPSSSRWCRLLQDIPEETPSVDLVTRPVGGSGQGGWYVFGAAPWRSESSAVA